MKLHIDIETYSSLDIKTVGAYKYFEASDFEILMVAYAFDNDPVQIIDLTQGEELPKRFLAAMKDSRVQKYAHNAAFERRAFNKHGIKTEPKNWTCTAIKAAYCGLPISLEAVSKALDLKDKAKLTTGRALIRLFCGPVKPTKANPDHTRNTVESHPNEWDEFKAYCIQDVEAERAIEQKLERYNLPLDEVEYYNIDQEINDRGVLVDLDLAQHAVNIAEEDRKILLGKMKALTHLDNPNSPAQLKRWLSLELEKEITSLTKDSVAEMLETAGTGAVRKVLKLRQKTGKTSVKKYQAILNCAADSGRLHGLLQFYGANRTGRWAGRIVQVHNLPQNHLDDLELARNVVKSGDYDLATLLYDSVPSVLSQLIRTTFVPKEHHILAVADFSAIEARVIAWLANETWRLDVFKTHGKIYEASASMMFGVPIEQIGRGSSLRDKGKVAELALGFGGAIGALTRMGGEKMGMTEAEMKDTVRKWRQANRKIVGMWYKFNDLAIQALKSKGREIVSPFKNITFYYDGLALTIKLPSGRKLFYYEPSLTTNKFDREGLQYKGVDQKTNQWVNIETYGGKIAENIVQATARDLLAESMRKLNFKYNIVMHVHDEVVLEIPENGSDKTLKRICDIMGEPVPWAAGLPLGAEGFTTKFYKKD